jgi:hypothetical protein
MSTIKVSNIQNASTSSGGIAIDTSGHVTVDGIAYPSAGSLSGRNRIINGDMRIDQRNAGASSTANAVFTVDRWDFGSGVASKLTWGQNYNSLTPPAGFTTYMGYKTTTAHIVGASEFFLHSQEIEGYNVSDLAFGTASAKSFTISFWVNSSLTGTFSVTFSNSAQNRCYPATYTISSANTWEYKTITIAGDTSGTWLTTNGKGLSVAFGLGVGSTFSGTAGSWQSSALLGATGATSVVGTLNATWNITGVQLEAGTVATPFERRSYGQELSLCQRYYQALGLSAYSDKFPTTNGTVGNATIGTGSNYAVTPINFPVPMRAVATVVFAGVTSTTGEIRNSATGATYPVTSYEATSQGLIRIGATGVASGTPLHYQFSATAEL